MLQPREACATATGDRACSTLGEAGKVAVNGHGVNLPVHYLRNYGRLGPAPGEVSGWRRPARASSV